MYFCYVQILQVVNCKLIRAKFRKMVTFSVPSLAVGLSALAVLNCSQKLTKLRKFFAKAHQAEASRRTHVRMDRKWDLHGICKGIKRDLQVRKNFAIVCDNTRKIGI